MNTRNRARVPFSKKILTPIKTFSVLERSIFFVFFGLFILSGLSIIWNINEHFLVDVPNRGGTLTEGIVGSPRFINPLLSISDADEDLTSLIYSGLLKATPSGELIDDLSKEHHISDDGLEYSFTLKDNIYFHDGEPVTASDVEFTVKKAQDSQLRSPKRINWDGITVKKIDDKNIKFILKQPYSPFIENLTMGILPEHIWRSLDSDQFAASLFNTEPVGSGPYKIKKIKRNSGGVPTYYQLEPFSKYSLGEPYIKNLLLSFYTNEEDALEAFTNGDIESISGIPPQTVNQIINQRTRIEKSSLPRIFGVFFNQNQAPVLINKEVRAALNMVVEKNRIVQSVLGGYGMVINGPLPFANLKQEENTDVSTSTPTDMALELLSRNGWTLNQTTGVMEKKTKKETIPLSFSISTGDAPELKQTALILQEEWQKIGAHVDIKIFETGDLNQNIIRPRKYDALLFGEVTGRDFDLYPFWHSSQRNDPGLNIAMYVNSKADKLLEEMRSTTDNAVKEEKYAGFEQLIKDDIPAIFTYTPDFIYLVPTKLKNIKLGEGIKASERFMNVHEWYIETNKVWKIFVKNN
ncbi:MAG: ABC transporter substrate-binding protein [Candidatus Paceibacterota bacterium]